MLRLRFVANEDITTSLDAEALPSVSVVKLKSMAKEYAHGVIVLREAKGLGRNLMVLAGFEDLSLPALLPGVDGAMRDLSHIVPKLHRCILPLAAVCTLIDPGLGATKKFGFPLSPTARPPTLPIPLGSEEAIEATLETAGLLTLRGEA